MTDLPTVDGPADPTDEVEVALPADHTAARVARRRASDLLRQWRLPALIDAVTLTVSELVTNAVRHGRPPVLMVLHRSPGRVEVGVHDGSSDLPRLQPTSEDRDSGRGVALVHALADTVEVREIPDDGKVVQVSFTTTNRPDEY